jgi:hypothetical protein
VLSLALFAALPFLLADPEVQPGCRERCEATYAADLATCDQRANAGESERAIDECSDAADDRRQDCLDSCND